MPTATARTAIPAGRFALRFCAWSLGLFGLLRLSWIEAHGVLPITRLQGHLAAQLSGIPTVPIEVTLACSGADALALCLGAVLAYPAGWRMRAAGAGGGLALILVLNTARIATLGRAAASPAWFDALHLYAWPAFLLLAIAGYVFAWMRLADARRAEVRASALEQTAPTTTRLTRRFVVLTAAFLVIFTAASPWYLQSTAVLAVAAFIARAAAVVLRAFGVEATAAGNILSTTRGAFMVTQECVSTPVIPVYVAAVFAYAKRWRLRALLTLAIVPLFVALGIARLLVVALPTTIVSSPMFLIHAFYQLVIAAVVVFLAAFWRHGAGPRAWSRAILGCALASALAYLLGPLSGRVVMATSGSLVDPQGALAFLPAFQLGLYVALCVATFTDLRWRPFVMGLALVGASQVAAFAALHAVLRYGGEAPHVRDVRAWALVVPLLVVLAVVRYDPPRR